MLTLTWTNCCQCGASSEPMASLPKSGLFYVAVHTNKYMNTTIINSFGFLLHTALSVNSISTSTSTPCLWMPLVKTMWKQCGAQQPLLHRANIKKGNNQGGFEWTITQTTDKSDVTCGERVGTNTQNFLMIQHLVGGVLEWWYLVKRKLWRSLHTLRILSHKYTESKQQRMKLRESKTETFMARLFGSTRVP